MATTLVSTGIQFPDGTTQTTAATAGATVTAASVYVAMPYGNYYHEGQNPSVYTLNMSGAVASVPDFTAHSRRFHTPYGQADGRAPTVTLQGVNRINYQRFQSITQFTGPTSSNNFTCAQWRFETTNNYGQSATPSKGVVNYKYVS